MFSRASIAAFLDQNWVRNGVIGVILFNAVLLGMETSRPLMDAIGPVILTLDKICLGIFVVELALKAIRPSLAILAFGLEYLRFHHHRHCPNARDPRLQRAAGAKDLATAAGGVGQPQPAARGGRVHHSAARHGVGVFADGHDLFTSARSWPPSCSKTASRNGSAIWDRRPIRCSRS